MSKRPFKKGDEVTLVSGNFLQQVSSCWGDKKAIVTQNENPDDIYVFVECKNGYGNAYLAKNLRLTKKNKTDKNNKDFIKKQKKDFLTTFLIRNFIIITNNDNKQ